MPDNTFKRHIDLLLILEEGKRHYVFIKHFNTCMYDHKLHQLLYADFESILVPEDNGKQNPNSRVLHKQISKIFWLLLCL